MDDDQAPNPEPIATPPVGPPDGPPDAPPVADAPDAVTAATDAPDVTADQPVVAPGPAEHYHVAAPPPEASAAPVTTPVPPVAPDPAPGATWRRGITVPAWLLALLALVLVVGGAFFLGRASADDDADRDLVAAVQRPDRSGPALQEPGNRGNGDTRPAARPLLGVSVRDAANDGGAQVIRVVDGSAADDAGLQVGDVIVSIGGQDVKDSEDLVAAVGDHDRGDDVAVAYTRGGDRHTAQVELGS